MFSRLLTAYALQDVQTVCENAGIKLIDLITKFKGLKFISFDAFK